MNTLRGKNFLSIMDLSKPELEWLIDEALYLKHQLDRGERHDELLKNHKEYQEIYYSQTDRKEEA